MLALLAPRDPASALGISKLAFICVRLLLLGLVMQVSYSTTQTSVTSNMLLQTTISLRTVRLQDSAKLPSVWHALPQEIAYDL